jgi:hypothetical protein
MALIDEGSCRSVTEPIGAASDENTPHVRPLLTINRIRVQNAGAPTMMFAACAPAMQRGGYAFNAASA